MQLLLTAALSVLLLGDSHALGIVRGGGPGFFQVVGEELGPDYEVRLSACPGSTSLDWTRPVQRDVPCSLGGAYEALARPNLPADIAVVLLGTNDAAGFGERSPLSAASYEQAMRTLVAALLHDGVRHVLLLAPPPSAGPFAGPRRRERLEAYREALRTLASETDRVSLGPDLLVLIEPGRHLPDGAVHFNAAGHRLVGERLAEDVRAVAAELEAEPGER
jgi:hypothetical protein